MTPNKLPPLPESKLVQRTYTSQVVGNIHATSHHDEPVFTADQMRAYAAEAIRQSQSLPAGAVAGVTDEQIVRFMSVALRHTEYKRGTTGPSVTEIRQGLHMAGIAALQADAREKGEAGWLPIETAPPAGDVLTWHDFGCVVGNPANPDYGLRGKVIIQSIYSGGMFPSAIIGTGMVSHWMPLPCGPATQPAQESEVAPCRHEAFQGRCVHCDAKFVNGVATSSQETASE